MTGRHDTDRRDALRTLLVRPLISHRTHPDEYDTVARHIGAVRSWAGQRGDWTVDHDRQQRVVRLNKTTPHPPATLPLARRPLNGRKMTLALVIAAIASERNVEIFNVVELRDTVTDLCARRDDLPDVDFTTSHSDRRDLADALTWLIDDADLFDVTDGSATDAATWAADGQAAEEPANAILRYHHGAADRLLLPRVHPDATTDPDDVATTHRSDRDEIRLFVDRPAAFLDDVGDMPQVRRARLTQTLARVANEIGVQLESRAEGWAGIDQHPTRPLAPTAFPHVPATTAHCALLLATRLADVSIDGPTVLTVSDLAEIVTDLVRTHARTARWRKDATASPHVLSRDVTDLLVAFDLLRPAGPGRWTTTPIVSRYAAQDPTEPDEEPS